MASHRPSIFGNDSPIPIPTTPLATLSQRGLNPLASTFYPGRNTHATTATLSDAARRLRGRALHSHNSSFNIMPIAFGYEMEYVLHYVVRPVARDGIRAIREEWICKLAAGVTKLLNGLGFDDKMVVKALIYYEYTCTKGSGHVRGTDHLLELARFAVLQDRAAEKARADAIYRSIRFPN